MARQFRNIHFTNCRFHENINNGLVVDPGNLDGFECENISLNNCSFVNPAWNINFVNGIVKSIKIIGCFFEQQGVLEQQKKLERYESLRITTEGTGAVIGCDFVTKNVSNADALFESHMQISLDAPPTLAIWRLIGNHFGIVNKV